MRNSFDELVKLVEHTPVSQVTPKQSPKATNHKGTLFKGLLTKFDHIRAKSDPRQEVLALGEVPIKKKMLHKTFFELRRKAQRKTTKLMENEPQFLPFWFQNQFGGNALEQTNSLQTMDDQSSKLSDNMDEELQELLNLRKQIKSKKSKIAILDLKYSQQSIEKLEICTEQSPGNFTLRKLSPTESDTKRNQRLETVNAPLGGQCLNAILRVSKPWKPKSEETEQLRQIEYIKHLKQLYEINMMESPKVPPLPKKAPEITQKDVEQPIAQSPTFAGVAKRMTETITETREQTGMTTERRSPVPTKPSESRVSRVSDNSTLRQGIMSQHTPRRERLQITIQEERQQEVQLFDSQPSEYLHLNQTNSTSSAFEVQKLVSTVRQNTPEPLLRNTKSIQLVTPKS